VLQRLGVRRRRPEWIRSFVTLPRLLAERGYASFQAGKHWEGDYALAGFTDGMLKPGQSSEHGGHGRWLGRDVPLDPVYEFIDAHADQPFFLWFAPMLPHVPHDAAREYRQRYVERGLVSSAVSYYANVTRFDDLVGELIAHLEDAGLRERTLVVYLADNGWEQDPHEVHGGLLGGERGKGSLYEMGLRTPIVFCWPGVVPGGAVSDAFVSTVDLFPTLLDYAGAPQRGEGSGRSLRPLIQDGSGWRRDRVVGMRSSRRRAEPSSERGEPETGFESFVSEPEDPEEEVAESASGRSRRMIRERSYFLRDRDWWFIWHRDRGADELYDARRDPRAERDLAAEHPETVERLRRQALAWDAETRRFLERRRRRSGADGPEANP
jgi:arylsulfatase A-like enzyme